MKVAVRFIIGFVFFLKASVYKVVTIIVQASF